MHYNNMRNNAGLKKQSQNQNTGKETEISIIKFYLVKFIDREEPKKRTESLIEIDKKREEQMKDMCLSKEQIDEYKKVAQEIFESFFGEFDLDVCMDKVIENQGDMEDAVNDLFLDFDAKVNFYINLFVICYFFIHYKHKNLLKTLIDQKKEFPTPSPPLFSSKEEPKLYPHRVVCLYEAEANANITGPNTKANRNILLKDSSVLVPENIFNLSFFIKDGLLLTSNFRLFSMNEADVHEIAKQEEFLKKFEGKVEKKIKKIESLQKKLTQDLENLSEDDPEQKASLSRVQNQLEILKKIQERIQKGNSESEKTEPPKPEKKNSKEKKSKANVTKTLLKAKYSKIQYTSTLLKIYTDVNQSFRTIPLSKKMAFDSKNNQFIVCYNTNFRGCSNRILSETFAFHSANSIETDLHKSLFPTPSTDSFDLLQQFSSASNLKSIFRVFLKLTESAHLHHSNLPERVMNWSDLFKFFLSVNKASGFDKKKAVKLANKSKKLDRMLNNKKKEPLLLTPEIIDFYYASEVASLQLPGMDSGASGLLRTDPESRFQESSIKRALIVNGKNSSLKFLIAHFKRSKNDLEMLLQISRFLVVWANNFSQLCAKEQLKEAEEVLFDVFSFLSGKESDDVEVSESNEGSVKQPLETKVVSAGGKSEEPKESPASTQKKESVDNSKQKRQILDNILKVIKHAWPVLLTNEEILTRWLTVPEKDAKLNTSLISFIFGDNPFLKNKFLFQNSTISVIPKPIPASKKPKKPPSTTNNRNFFKTPKTKKHQISKKSSAQNKSKPSAKTGKSEPVEFPLIDSPKKPREMFKEQNDYKIDPLWFANWIWNDLQVMGRFLNFFISQAKVLNEGQCSQVFVAIGRLVDRMAYLLTNKEGVDQAKKLFKSGFELLEDILEINERNTGRLWSRLIQEFPGTPECISKVLKALEKFEESSLQEINEEDETQEKNFSISSDSDSGEDEGNENEGKKESAFGKCKSKEELVGFVEGSDLAVFSREDLNGILSAFEEFDSKLLADLLECEVLKALKIHFQLNEKLLFIVWTLLHGVFPRSQKLHSFLLKSQNHTLSLFTQGTIK